MKNEKLEKNIKKLVIFFVLCFSSLIVYMSYFYIYTADRIVNDSTNKRVSLYDNDTIRGSILDRNGKIIANSTRNKNGQQDRIYSKGLAFAHITGYDSLKYSKTGLELSYNDILQGRNFLYSVFGSMARSVVDEFAGKEKKGNDVYTTIDYDSQITAYNMLQNQKGGVVAINPKTGEILVMTSAPSYDPQSIDTNFDSLKKNDQNPFVNRAASGYYPPGSVFKIITLASALENNVVSLNDSFNCNGKLNIGDYTLGCEGNAVHGHISLKDAFKLSCNVTFGSIGMKVGIDNLRNTAQKFMFNKSIPVGDEFDSIHIKSGEVTIEDEKSKALLAQDSIGQHGVTANPMQMALTVAAVANNGTIMKPYIVKEIKNKYGVVIDSGEPQKLSDAISSNTASVIKDFMIETVKSGTGTNARINGITVAGKTGSAEDENDKPTHSWFVAFAPAEDPKIAIAVIVENAGMGGGKAADIAREVIKTYLKAK